MSGRGRRSSGLGAFAALAVFAAACGVGLWAGWRVAERHADDVEEGRDPIPVAAPAPPGAIAATAPLSTPLLSYRRVPEPLAERANEAALAEALGPLAAILDRDSCLAVAVDGREVAATNPLTPLIPASNVKLLVAAVVLDAVGADRFFTTVVRADVGDGGVVAGDLYLVGGGDPLLASAWWDGGDAAHPQFNETSFEGLADAVVAAGITSIGGDVVGDGTRYDPEQYPPLWTPDLAMEAGPAGGLVANDGRMRDGDLVDDPAEGAARELRDMLHERGVQIGGRPVAGVAPAGVAVVASVESASLSAIVAEMLTTSDDGAAEMLLREIGYQVHDLGSRTAGILEIAARVRRWGIAAEGLRLIDGSGLSSENRLTCSTLLGVLARGSPGDALGTGLAVAGAPGGTLNTAFVGGPMEGRLRAKTGTLSNADSPLPAVKALSGYVPTDGAGTIEFSLILNGEAVDEEAAFLPLWTALADALATYPSGPSADDLAPR